MTPVHPLSRPRRLLQRFWPLAVLAALLLWGWRGLNLWTSVPAYGDTMEFMWVLSWYAEALLKGESLTVYPLAFYPAGWQYAENLLMLLVMQPLVWLAGPAFAYNIAILVSFVVAFIGAYLLARRFVDRLGATVVAVLVAFAGFRWFHHIGHVNIFIGSALLPWILLALDKGLSPSLSGARQRAALWVAAGVLLAAAMSGSLYFAFIGAVAVVAWTAGCLAARTTNWRTAVMAVAVTGGVSLLLTMPSILWLWRQSTETGVGFYTLADVNFWSASLNALPIPSIDHPWLGGFARSIYRGTPFEQGATNFGLLALALAAAGLFIAWRRPAWRPVAFLAIAGVVLTLGVVAKWDDAVLRWDALRPLNTLLWQAGHAVKPNLFTVGGPVSPFDTAVPLPGYLFAALVPFAERARVFARFAFVGGLGVFLLAALALSSLRYRWLAAILAVLLLLEVLPRPLQALPLPPAAHPAFTWLRQQPGASDQGSVVDLVAAHPFTPVLLNEGDSVYATQLHGWPAVAGASSIWPAHTMFLFRWLATHPHAFLDKQLAPLLQQFRARYVLLHLRSDLEQGLLDEARQNPDLTLVNCFDPPPTPGPWSYPICVFEVAPPANPNLNLVLDEGWSGVEPWGVWATGTDSKALWVAYDDTPRSLHVEAFPQCVAGQQQSLSVVVNDQPVAAHDWTDCEPWSQIIPLPAGLVRLGANDVSLHTAYAVSPNEATGGENPDPRPLSLGFTRLAIEP